MKSQRAFHLKLALVLLLAAFLSGSASAQCLDSCYHTRAGIDTFITNILAYDSTHFHVVHVDTIGWSRGQQLGVQYPLYAVKISDNPDVFEDEPTALIVGHVHAEEVIGVETVISYIWRLVTQYGLYHTLIQNTQLYFVPTGNPDGLEVVSRNWDCTYRKNGYVPPQLDSCIIVNGMGQDSCGVDLNRNFDTNWIYGDSLWYSTALERFDYYRGPAPMSEPESQAIANLGRQIKPAISAVFHSSRAGGNAERSIAAWAWGDVRVSPDCTAIGYLNNLYCNQFGTTRYHMAFGSQRNGNLQDWFYRELGTIQYNTELGPPIAIQPRCTGLDSLTNIDRGALNWFCERLLNLGHEAQTPVTIHTRDLTNLQPISAEWRYLDTWTQILRPWYTDSIWGRATTLLIPQGNAHIMARKEGYADTTISVTVNPPNDPQSFSLFLRPLPWHALTVELRGSDNNPLSGRVYLDGEFPHWLDVPVSGAVIDLPEGDFSAMAIADTPDHMVVWRSFFLGGDGTQVFYLPARHQTYTENFDGGLANWTASGAGNPWRVCNDTTANGYGNTLCMAPDEYRGQYANNLNARLACNTWITLGSSDTTNAAYMTMWRSGRMDMPADSFFVEVRTAMDTVWAPAAAYSDLELPWTQSYINLSQWAGQTIQLRFRFETDPYLGDLGLNIDNLAIYSGTVSDSPGRRNPVAYSYKITGSYPNPFNPSTTIMYETAAPGTVRLVFFNTLGQEVRRFNVNAAAAGPQRLIWDGTSSSGNSVSSGLYFVQLQAGSAVSTHKLLLMR